MKIEDVINRSELSERLDGDMELFRELAELFIEDSQKLLNAINDAIESKDAEKLRKYAHTIKGSVSNFSAQEAYDTAYDLETIGRNGELQKASEVYTLLQEKIEEARQAMKMLIREDKL